MYKKIILLIILFSSITILILGIYYGVVQNRERMVERGELFKTIYIHIDLNAQKVKKMLKDFPIYYINLDRVKDRRDFMEKQIKKYGVKMTRISAVDALDLDWKSGMANDIPYENHYERHLTPDNHTGNYKMTELACTLSHLYTIKQSYDNGDEIALILEDDVDIGLAALWDNSLKELIKSVPTGWECINLFSFDIVRKKYNDIFVPLELGKHWRAGAYVINRKGMEKVLKVYNKNKFILQGPKYLVADYFIYSLADNVYTYTKKFLFILSDFTSNIQGGNVTNYTVLGQTLVDDMREYVCCSCPAVSCDRINAITKQAREALDIAVPGNWFLVEGTLIASLRWGEHCHIFKSGKKNFVDSDIDVYVITPKGREAQTAASIGMLLKKYGWTEPKDRGDGIYVTNSPLQIPTKNCILGGPSKNFYMDIHIMNSVDNGFDVGKDMKHLWKVFLVNDLLPKDIIFPLAKCSWGGGIAYAPAKYLEVLAKWNGKEYGSIKDMWKPIEDNGKYPYLATGQVFKCNCKLTGQDIEEIKDSIRSLRSRGLATFELKI